MLELVVINSQVGDNEALEMLILTDSERTGSAETWEIDRYIHILGYSILPSKGKSGETGRIRK